MKNIIFILMVVFSLHSTAQQDTIQISPLELADSVFGLLHSQNIPSGRLFNRLFIHEDSSIVGSFAPGSSKVTNADCFYRALIELKYMSVDTSTFLNQYDSFREAERTLAHYEFEESKTVIPIGIVDYRYQSFNEVTAENLGHMNMQQLRYQDVYPSNNPAYQTKRVHIVAPMYDYLSDNVMYLLLKQEWIHTDHLVDIASVTINLGTSWETLVFDELFRFTPKNASMQTAQVRVYYTDHSMLETSFQFSTPELNVRLDRGSFCDEEGTVRGDGLNNNLGWCLKRGCSTAGNEDKVDKPYIFVTGYRPPIVSQSYEKTYELYSTNHNNYLQTLGNSSFDVFIVRFNIYEYPETHGMIESARLLVKFIEYVNERKERNAEAAYNENIIQGSSMGADIARLALLYMDRDHITKQTPPHHCRLYFAYDANFYGANLPLSYQMLIQSFFAFPDPLLTGQFVGSILLQNFTYSALRQKATRQLLQYHVGGGLPLIEGNYRNPFQETFYTPTHHNERTRFLEELESVDHHQFIIPLSKNTRNISVSLGKISGKNNEEPELDFNDKGEFWRDLNSGALRFYLKSAKYVDNGSYFKLFQRSRFFDFKLIPFIPMNQRTSVSYMQEIDNASGSYLGGLGNLIRVANEAYFGPLSLLQPETFFSHKSVITGLAINPTLWPADGSLSLNMKDLKLMFNKFDFNPNIPSDYSDYYGYPNLGRPNDHFQVTPFEAIYVDNEIDEHINLKESDPTSVSELCNFLYSEMEPDNLYLQNWTVGAQANSNYTYKVRRRAATSITIGAKVTPSTDPGFYQVAANADLKLVAGKFIEIDGAGGFDNVMGAKWEMSVDVNYEQCNTLEREVSISNNKSSGEDWLNKTSIMSESEMLHAEIRVFPNPASGSFSVHANDIIESVTVLGTDGVVLKTIQGMDNQEIRISEQFPKGIYFLQIQTKERTHFSQLIVQ